MGGGGWVQRGGPGGAGGMPNQMRGQRGGRMNTRTMNNPVSDTFDRIFDDQPILITMGAASQASHGHNIGEREFFAGSIAPAIILRV